MRWAGCAVVVSLLLSAGGGAIPSPRLPAEAIVLRGAAREARPARSTDQFVARRRAVDVDLKALRKAAPGTRVRFDLFDDVRVRGVVEHLERRPEGMTLSGRLEEGAGGAGGHGGGGGSFLFVLEQAQLSGGIRTTDGRIFEVGTDLEGRPLVQEAALDRLPECAGSVVANPSGPASGAGAAASVTALPDAASPEAASPDPRDLIDVMVAYTERAEAAAGGPAAARALAQRAVDEANAAYVNSGIDTRLRLVWRGATQYDETLDDHQTHLTRLRLPNDGYMDELHAIRDAYGADVVSLFVDDSEAAGLGYLMQQPSTTFAGLAFSVVYWFTAASNNLTLAHEIGHNQGCEHDRANASGNPSYNYAYGERFVGNDGRWYRTVMGYLPGQRIQNFSNPAVFYQGQPTGRDNKEDNARAIRNTAVTVANFRPRRTHPGSLRDFDGNGADDLSTFDSQLGTLWIGLARGGTFDIFAWEVLSAAAVWSAQVEGDFDGDGWKDLASFDAAASKWWVSRSLGDRFQTASWLQQTPASGWERHLAADFDGDGRDDVASFNAATRQWWVGRSTGSAFASALWGTLSASSTWTDALAGDFDGDGRGDLAQENDAGEWWVGLSSGSGFSLAAWVGTGDPSGWSSAVVGDYDGDGRSDLAQYRAADGSIRVELSTGSAFVPGTWGSFPAAGGAGGGDGGGCGAFLSGDFDGDGLADIACFAAPDARFWVGLSTGSAFSVSLWSALDPAAGWSRHVTGDFNGDGKIDVASYLLPKGEWWVGLSSGSGFAFSLWGKFVLPRAGVDTDGDGVDDASDCDPTRPEAWAIPGEVETLTLLQPGGPGSATMLVWTEPAFRGGLFVQYDVLRSDSPFYFGWGSVACLETNDGADREALDASVPAPIWFYLVRGGNACGEAELGVDSQGNPRTGVSCP